MGTMIPALREYTQSRVQRYFPYADWKAPVHSETCLYTVTRQHEFLLDQVPGQPNIVVGGGGVAMHSNMVPLSENDCADSHWVPLLRTKMNMRTSPSTTTSVIPPIFNTHPWGMRSGPLIK